MATTTEIKQAINNYNGKKRIKDIEITHIKWFMRTQNLSLEEAVKAYYEDKEAEKHLSYKEYVSLRAKICSEIRTHCETCPMKGYCIKDTLLDTWTLEDIKIVQRSECWRNPK